ncbi:DNA primase [Chromatiales bacterium (ex Bugula neritina AB1)]|nr:DNA primase [Chromatiales bacterium (ex Bugula neritina AB1)]
MAGRIPQSFIDDLLARVDIVEIIDRYVPLKKTGANHKACCPFHGEKTPSFNVSQTKQFYHCFGCGVHGTAISFLMDFDHMHFVDAVEYLADRVGLTVPRDVLVPVSASQQGLYDTLKQSAIFFQNELRTSQEAISYLKNRGISGETALEFQLGFAPSAWHSLTKKFGNSESSLLTSGMLVRNDSGKTHDRFRNRIMYPIRDRRGRVIGFGGRVMDNSEPKYLNSPETPLFQKGRELYGLYELRKATRNSPQRIIVVEGYMDVIALAQAGLKYAVATLGTATSSEQVSLLFRETDEVVFCFDGDSAGRKAAWRALNSALPSLKSGRDARFMFLADGKDPDNVVNEHGSEHFIKLIQEESLEASEFLLQELQRQAGKGSETTGASHKARLAELARPLVEKMPSGVYRNLVQEQFEQLVGVEVFPKRSARQSVKTNSNQTTQPTQPTAVRSAITAILNEPAIIWDIDPEEFDFSDQIPGAQLLLNIISLIELQPGITSSGILENYRDKPEWNILNKLALSGLADSDESSVDKPLNIARHAIRKLNEESLRRQLKADAGGVARPSEMSEAEKEELRRKFSALKK